MHLKSYFEAWSNRILMKHIVSYNTPDLFLICLARIESLEAEVAEAHEATDAGTRGRWLCDREKERRGNGSEGKERVKRKMSKIGQSGGAMKKKVKVNRGYNSSTFPTTKNNKQ